MTEEYQGPVQLNSPTPKESLGFWKSVETGAKDSALDIVKGLAYADTLQNKGLSWAMREYRTALGVQQPTYLERHLYLENNVMNHLGEWATVHTTEDELHQQNEFGSFIGQAIPFLAGGVAAKGLEGTAAGARALAAEGAAKDVETEAAETAAYNKSALKSGIVHRYVSYNASMLPVDAGQSVSFNKKGQMSLNGKQFAESTAFSQIPFGVFEGAGMAFRQTFLKGSTIDLAGSKKYETEKKKDEGVTQNPEMEVKGDSIEEPAPDEESDPVKVSKSTQEEEAGESTQETFDRLFTPEQQKALDREATGEPLEGTTGHQIANDVEHAKESLPYIYHAISSNVGNEYGPISLKRAAISRFGILIKGIRRSIRDVQTMLDVKEAERKMKDYKTEKGSRRFYFSNKLQEYLLKNKHKISASRLAEINEQDSALFDAEPWTIKGAQIEHVKGFVKSEDTGIRTFNYPKWYRALKKKPNKAIIERIRQQAEDGDQAAEYMESIINESYKSVHIEQALQVFGDMIDAIHNPMDEAEQKGVFEALDNGFENLGDAERERRLNDAIIEYEEHDKSVYTDPKSEFYAKVLAHFDNPKLEQYASCMLGA